MYLTVSVGPLHMESSTELFIEKLFFRRWSLPNFPHLCEPPNKNPPNRYMSVQRPATLLPSLEITLANT